MQSKSKRLGVIVGVLLISTLIVSAMAGLVVSNYFQKETEVLPVPIFISINDNPYGEPQWTDTALVGATYVFQMVIQNTAEDGLVLLMHFKATPCDNVTDIVLTMWYDSELWGWPVELNGTTLEGTMGTVMFIPGGQTMTYDANIIFNSAGKYTVTFWAEQISVSKAFNQLLIE